MSGAGRSKDLEFKKWKALFDKETEAGSSSAGLLRSTSGVQVKPLYTENDLSLPTSVDSLPGLEPYTRGAKASMYVKRPWTLRQYAGFSTAEESNLFYKKILADGGQGISVAFDLPTHRGYDSDNALVRADVGKAGVAVDSVLDMKQLFQDIPMDKVSISMTMSGAVLPILACYIVTAEEQGVPLEKLSGTIQNDILKEFLVRNTYIYPPQSSMKIVNDIFSYTSKRMPKFNSISISGYHLQEAGADSVLELAYTLANAQEYIRGALASGLDIDDFAPRISFFFGIGMDFYGEIAKLRAARLLWCRIVDSFHPKNPSSKILRTHCQTSGWSLTRQEPLNNIVRTTIEAMAAVFGGTQSLHTNSYDEALALPSDSSSRIARNTQLILQEETGITQVIDPWGGSFMMESLTHQIAEKAWSIIEEIEKQGGMLKFIESGSPKLEVEKAAAKKQARIDQGLDVVVGVNKYLGSGADEDIDLFHNDNEKILKAQGLRLNSLRQKRDPSAISQALNDLTTYAKTGRGNALELAVVAMRARATVGEVTTALENVWGRHCASNQSVSGAYDEAFVKTAEWHSVVSKIAEFTNINGSKPKILIAKLGQDGHDRGAKVVAAGLADLGFEVCLSALFSVPQEVVKDALEKNVHFIACSSLVGGHNALVSELMNELKRKNGSDKVVVVGGVIPKKDHNYLFGLGVRRIFEPGSSILTSAEELLKCFNEK